ncbi:alpha/beta hydrolase [Caballeronia sp. LZ035]|uniref:alpha/beta fold hydrolase n=1 Tax=Caballeronia sp. LZ035 TaxID=3038568 RepID=UPI00285D71C2|nr:alpha/beta hydrolase [Caballeronia sp. LZ035]MDR5756847.1 alpha/beta hydrolase [Caballeronia sp. LZ035]
MNTFAADETGNILRYLDLYSDSSTEQPLLFIHGLGCASSSDYSPVVASKSYSRQRSLLMDLMGSGFSDKPHAGKYSSVAQVASLSKFIGAQAFSSVDLFGHSAGAFIALKLAQDLPKRRGMLILCEPGINEYGVSMLSEITAMSEDEFVEQGFAAFLAELKVQGTNDAWLGPFSVASSHAIYQWATSALDDNASDWIGDLARLDGEKGVILSASATSEDIGKFEQAGCVVQCVPDTAHMIAYDNPEGLAEAISNLLRMR